MSAGEPLGLGPNVAGEQENKKGGEIEEKADQSHKQAKKKEFGIGLVSQPDCLHRGSYESE